MIKLKDILLEVVSYNAWVIPDEDTLRREFKVEHEYKNLNLFDDVEEFLTKVKDGEITPVSKSDDMSIINRSRTGSFDSLLNLISSYASYPKYRNEDTLKDLYTKMEENKELDFPIVLQYPDGRRRIFSGNTRMDVAFQLGITPKVILINV
jgi:hypothetical protein